MIKIVNCMMWLKSYHFPLFGSIHFFAIALWNPLDQVRTAQERDAHCPPKANQSPDASLLSASGRGDMKPQQIEVVFILPCLKGGMFFHFRLSSATKILRVSRIDKLQFLNTRNGSFLGNKTLSLVPFLAFLIFIIRRRANYV